MNGNARELHGGSDEPRKKIVATLLRMANVIETYSGRIAVYAGVDAQDRDTPRGSHEGNLGGQPGTAETYLDVGCGQ